MNVEGKPLAFNLQWIMQCTLYLSAYVNTYFPSFFFFNGGLKSSKPDVDGPGSSDILDKTDATAPETALAISFTGRSTPLAI